VSTDTQVAYRGRWEEGEPGWRRYRQGPHKGDRYEVLTFTCGMCADALMHSEREHKLVLEKHPGRYVREAHRGFRPKRRPRQAPDPKSGRRRA